MLTHEEIITSVKNAFLPLPCTAEILDLNSKLQFKVSDFGRTVIRSGEMALRYAEDKELLHAVLKQFRSRIQSKGFVLNEVLN
jgi:hypothetical protein